MSGTDRGERHRRLTADELLAEAHREFREGLWARMDRLRACLEGISRGSGGEIVEIFFRTAHSLKGTAPSFGAYDLTDPAAELTEMGRRWSTQGTGPSEGELARARVVLARLKDAARRFAESSWPEVEG